MKRAAAHLFKRQSENRAFSKVIELLLRFKTAGQYRGAKTRPQGQLKCANLLGSRRGGGWSGLELTDTLPVVQHRITPPCRGNFPLCEQNANVAPGQE